MKTKEITPEQYAEWKGCTVQNITKHLRNGKFEFLPEVKGVKKYSRFYTLVVPIDLLKSPCRNRGRNEKNQN
jgi:hypothetical protein